MVVADAGAACAKPSMTAKTQRESENQAITLTGFVLATHTRRGGVG